MQLDSFKSVVIALAFLVPGYVWSATLSYFISRRSRDAALRLLEFFTLSCVNNSLWLLLYLSFQTSDSLKALSTLLKQPNPTNLQNLPTHIVVLLFLAFFISPFVFGWVLGKFSSNKRIAFILGVLGWKPGRSIPTAWDYWFGLEKEVFLSITMTNGSKVLGYFGSQSFAGDGTPEQRDIYIEKVYTTGKGGLQLVDRTDGILINREQIAHIEFYTP